MRALPGYPLEVFYCLQSAVRRYQGESWHKVFRSANFSRLFPSKLGSRLFPVYGYTTCTPGREDALAAGLERSRAELRPAVAVRSAAGCPGPRGRKRRAQLSSFGLRPPSLPAPLSPPPAPEIISSVASAIPEPHSGGFFCFFVLMTVPSPSACHARLILWLSWRQLG